MRTIKEIKDYCENQINVLSEGLKELKEPYSKKDEDKISEIFWQIYAYTKVINYIGILKMKLSTTYGIFKK